MRKSKEVDQLKSRQNYSEDNFLLFWTSRLLKAVETDVLLASKASFRILSLFQIYRLVADGATRKLNEHVSLHKIFTLDFVKIFIKFLSNKLLFYLLHELVFITVKFFIGVELSLENSFLSQAVQKVKEKSFFFT